MTRKIEISIQGEKSLDALREILRSMGILNVHAPMKWSWKLLTNREKKIAYLKVKNKLRNEV